ncbi:MAG: hypothetical protein EAX91_13200 [Candidatus Lokiarchaeota archaeon]|nr:hypothetical protein [Candidatus Lokiarchaeota archaeon]
MTPIKNPPHKLKAFKRDIAPIGFFFDLFSNENYDLPILPVPMRIDKIVNGQPTLVVPLDFPKLDRICNKYSLNLDYNLFFKIGIHNLVTTARRKYKEIIIHQLKDKFIINWWEQSKLLKAEIPSLTKDFSYILSKFIKLYSKFLESDDISNQVKLLIEYCEKIVKYLKRRLKSNCILTSKKGNTFIQKIYNEKKRRIYPQIAPVSVYNIQTEEVKDMYFIPYLIYDDLIDIFFYNLRLLNDKTPHVNLKRFQENSIINKRPKIITVKKEDLLTRIEAETFL